MRHVADARQARLGRSFPINYGGLCTSGRPDWMAVTERRTVTGRRRKEEKKVRKRTLLL